MPKLKTKSSVKKRFSLTASGKVRMKPAGKRHGMIKRSSKMKRQARAMTLMSKADGLIIKGFMPYGIR
ncbi:MAG: 50S ribosomal protein L35 [Alphaproteobacteria bacterium GM202ARS2]|nr:50S ribosomal protein L35 [Alphaproteobacteria bacterium GM202ARS2]